MCVCVRVCMRVRASHDPLPAWPLRTAHITAHCVHSLSLSLGAGLAPVSFAHVTSAAWPPTLCIYTAAFDDVANDAAASCCFLAQHEQGLFFLATALENRDISTSMLKKNALHMPPVQW